MTSIVVCVYTFIHKTYWYIPSYPTKTNRNARYRERIRVRDHRTLGRNTYAFANRAVRPWYDHAMPNKPDTRGAIRTLLDGVWNVRDVIAIATLLLAAAIAWAEYGAVLAPAELEPAADTDASSDASTG
jgi:hypothetical protein